MDVDPSQKAPAPHAPPAPLMSSTTHNSVLGPDIVGSGTVGGFADVINSDSGGLSSSVASATSAAPVTTAFRASPTYACAKNLISMKKGNDHLKNTQELNLRAKKEAKNDAKRQRNKMSYMKKHFEKQIRELNGTSNFEPKKIQFTDGPPVPGICLDTNKINWRVAYQMSVSGNVVQVYTRGKVILEHHVVVLLPDGRYEAIEEGRIRLEPPPQVNYRSYHMKVGTLVTKYTEDCSGQGNNKQYCLIRYENKQFQWVPKEEIICDEGKRNVRKPNFYRNPTRNCNLLDSQADQNDNNSTRGGECLALIPTQQHARFKKIFSTAKNLLSIDHSISGAVTEALGQHPAREGTGVDGNSNIKIMAETSLIYEHLTSEKKEGKHLPLEDVIGGGLDCVAGLTNLARSGNVLECEGSSVMVKQLLQLKSGDSKDEGGKTQTEQERQGEDGESSAQAQKDKKIQDSDLQNNRKTKKPHQKQTRDICQHPGCTTPAHTSTLPHCKKHSEKPKSLCVHCQKNESRRKFKLCETCFQKLHPNKSLCRHCSLLGYDRKPREFGGLCTKCIGDGVKDERKCVNCHERPRERGGGLCYFCYNDAQEKR